MQTSSPIAEMKHLAGQGHRAVAFIHDQQQSGEYVSAGMLSLGGLNAGLAEVLARGAGPSESEPDVTLHALPDDSDPSTAREVSVHRTGSRRARVGRWLHRGVRTA